MQNAEYYFYGKEDTVTNCSHCYYIWGDIHINIHELLGDVKRDKVSFEKAFSETISHEFLHYLVYQLEGYAATTWIDTLTNDKLKSRGKEFSIKHWHGGIYEHKEVQE